MAQAEMALPSVEEEEIWRTSPYFDEVTAAAEFTSKTYDLEVLALGERPGFDEFIREFGKGLKAVRVSHLV